MYPVLCDGVSIGTFLVEGSDTKHYFIENAAGEEFEISQSLHDALLKVDGSTPLDLPNEGKEILSELKKRGIISTSRFVRTKGLFNRFILFQVRNSEKGKTLCKAINAILPVMAILIFSVSVALMNLLDIQTGNETSIWIYIGFLLLSLAFHEAGHFIAGTALDYAIHDIGILLFVIIPLGAYVAHEDKSNASKADRIQFALAGIEMNLLFAGIALLFAMLCYPLSATMVIVANMNVALAIVNLLPAEGLDGESALSAMFGVESISKIAKICFRQKKFRHKLFHSGIKGYAVLCIFLFILMSKMLLWVLICLDVIAVIYKLF